MNKRHQVIFLSRRAGKQDLPGDVFMDLVITPVNSKEWKLLKGISLIVFNKKWEIPEGFITDFASIPKIFHGIFSPWDIKHGPAAILHDYLYQFRLVPRKEADGIFLEAMRIRGVGWVKRHIFYRAVRTFGQDAYDDDNRKARLRSPGFK